MLAQELGDGRWRIRWSIAFPDGRRTRQYTSFGNSAGLARRAAREKAAMLLSTSVHAAWKPSSPIEDFIEQVSLRAIAENDLSDLTKKSYERSVRLLLGQCGGSRVMSPGGKRVMVPHTHKYRMVDYTIEAAMQYRFLERLLREITRLHGHEAGRQVLTVLQRYVIGELVPDHTISGSPLTQVQTKKLLGMKPPARTRGGKAVTAADYRRVMQRLLEMDPAEGIVRRQGRWSLEDQVNRRRNAIDQTLLQLATGLRSSEANQIRCFDLYRDANEVMLINVRSEVAKGSRSRDVVVVEPVVAEHLEQRRKGRRATDYLIGSPADPTKVWDYSNRNKSVAVLYRQLADELGVGIMLSERSHMWRTTLRTLYAGKVSEAVLNAQFGHTTDVALKHYSDVADLSGLIAASGQKVSPERATDD